MVLWGNRLNVPEIDFDLAREKTNEEIRNVMYYLPQRAQRTQRVISFLALQYHLLIYLH